jgi:hypothetical protein
MQLLFLSATMIAAALATPAAAQTPPVDTYIANPSLLAPRMPEAPLPPPTPLAPPTLLGPAAIPSPVPSVAPASPVPEPGTVAAVPLPPPVPATIPFAPAVSAGPGAAVGAPISLAPTPLTSPRAAASSGTTKPGAKAATPLVSTRLPTPELTIEASPADFLRAARGAVAAGRNGEARSALEMAQTRLLDRAVDAGKESVPSNNLVVRQISDAINALVSNDRMACLRYIEFASQTIGSPLN